MPDTQLPKGDSGWHVSQSDHFKAIFEYLKHVSTLATGSILLITTFLGTLFPRAQHSWSVAVAVAAFFLSLVGSTATYSILIRTFPRNDRPLGPHTFSKIEMFIYSAGLIGAWISLIVGVGAIVFFFLANWYVRQ